MGYFYIERIARTKQPDGAVPVDANVLPSGSHVWNFSKQLLRNIRTGEIGSFNGATFSNGQLGRSVLHDLTTEYTKLATSDVGIVPTSGGCTVLLEFRKLDATARASGGWGLVTSTAAQRFGCNFPWSDGKVYWDFGGTTEGTSRLSIAGMTFEKAVWAFTVGTRGMEIWKAGKRVAANSANPTRTAASSELRLNYYGGVGGDLNEFSFFAVIPAQLTVGLLQTLTVNPWQLFQPLERRIWVPSAGGGITVTPAAAIARALGIAPTTVLGSTSATPAAAIAKAAAVAPTTVLGSLTIAPAVAAARALAQIGDVVLGSVSVTPSAAAAKAAAVIGSVIGGGGIVVTAAAAIARALAVAPSVVLGSTSVSPAAAIARTVARIGNALGGALASSSWVQYVRRKGRR